MWRFCFPPSLYNYDLGAVLITKKWVRGAKCGVLSSSAGRQMGRWAIRQIGNSADRQMGRLEFEHARLHAFTIARKTHNAQRRTHNENSAHLEVRPPNRLTVRFVVSHEASAKWRQNQFRVVILTPHLALHTSHSSLTALRYRSVPYYEPEVRLEGCAPARPKISAHLEVRPPEDCHPIWLTPKFSLTAPRLVGFVYGRQVGLYLTPLRFPARSPHPRISAELSIALLRKGLRGLV